ncbi:hypothetical protein FRACYDRAFT_264654 [Fragilariopsis cylindrus CCMP1102]|uniref:Uncharacterized protein n=1 Tax=Fragilariopsis cylindrus CCMP1102 TaxID=635003 RepID=A0A1E7EQV9_9STRA|nr:hypothetical protein FRACYDRAFT_264654 [Fragilariopsis cylindrus CCMP1102]|eukprot:OEU08207.1 hypothetical protein FRACYDRAFT_264654 [Fragilariopsis cylindrus CCMP1102]
MMKISHNNPLVLMALTWVSSSVSDARIIGGSNSNIQDDRGLSDKDYKVYAYNPCKQEVFAQFTYLNDQVHVNHGKCKQIGDTPGENMSYRAFTKNGSDSNYDTIKVGEVSLQKAWNFKNECDFDNGTPSNVRVVKLSCPSGIPGKHNRDLSSSSNDDDKYQVYACNPCDQEVFADFSFLDNGNDTTVHVNHGKCKSIGAHKTNKQSKINYTAYTKTGSDIDNIMITRKDVDVDKVSELNEAASGIDKSWFPLSLSNLVENSSVPDNSFVVELSCPTAMDASFDDDDKYQVYACNFCDQDVFADFNFNFDNGNDINVITVHANHGKCKSIGTLKNNKDYLIDYTTYTKTGSDIDNNKFTVKDVDLDKTESIKEVESRFDDDNFPLLDTSSFPDNSRVVELVCPPVTPGKRTLSPSSDDNDMLQVYACNPCYQEVFADFNFPGNDSAVHVNHGKCKSIATLKNNKDYLIDYTAYTKTGSDIDNNKITVKDVDLDKTESIKEVASEYNIDFPDSDSNLLIPENNSFVILSCPAMLDS